MHKSRLPEAFTDERKAVRDKNELLVNVIYLSTR